MAWLQLSNTCLGELKILFAGENFVRILHISGNLSPKFLSGSIMPKSCYESAHICPIRAEIPTHEHLENVFNSYFLCLIVIGFRQNYFHILRNFGAKMSFSCYIINKKNPENVYKSLFPPPPCSKTPLTSQMCIYITNNLCKWPLGTRGGGGGNNVLQTKNGEGQLTTHEIRLYPIENFINHKLFDKIMKFCILVVHDLNCDISYDA